ncbi:secondary thiamine-phosphate synthase enzyme YjbQ [uncultured Neptuniibacter sp.]|uniref:secondary thiamine-phosphate synthase enzyme YjbQ n=1 Tax=uncultured Neptuniibacter sp. TaxID=502143 RepID=UPI00263480B4|nr:secondary thiamine-phosphate synthase enzyme YjbQ [uncultured Neptuniibacter sp.]
MVEIIKVRTGRQGLYEFTYQVQNLIDRSTLESGLCSLLIQHTSASLTIQENADPSAKVDLENWFNRLVVERDSIYTHTLEGDDDMPAHIKSALTATSLSIPFKAGRLCLGAWQGIYCWEHRHNASERSVAVHIGN